MNSMTEEPARRTRLLRLGEVLSSQKAHLQNLSVLIVVNFLLAGLGFATRVKIANTLGKEQFGLLAYGLVLGSYGAVFVRFGLERTLIRDLIHYPKRFANLVTASLALRGILLAVVLVALILWKCLVGIGTDLSWGVIAVVLSSSVISLDLQAVYDSWQRMSRHAIYRLVQKCCYFVFIWFVVLSAPDRLSINIIGSAMLGAVTFYLMMQYRWAFKRIDFSRAKESLRKATLALGRENLLVWLAGLGSLSFGALNQLVLKYYKGNAELGGYAAAWQIFALTIIVINQVSRIGKPAIARITRPEISRGLRVRFLAKYAGVMFLAVSPIFLPAMICPKLVLQTLFRPEYVPAAGILRVLSLYIMLFSLGGVASQYLISARMERVYFASVLFGGLLSVVLCFLLIPTLSSMGAALALLIAHGTTMGIYWVAVINHVRPLKGNSAVTP